MKYTGVAKQILDEEYGLDTDKYKDRELLTIVGLLKIELSERLEERNEGTEPV